MMEKIRDQDKVQQLLETFDSVFSPSLSEDGIDLKRYAEKLITDAITYVVKEGNEMAGFISFYVGDERLEHSFITLLAVLPEYQGKKIAQTLIDQCIQMSIAMGKKGIKLEVGKNNFPAITFYQKNKFKIVEGGAENSVYMEKRI